MATLPPRGPTTPPANFGRCGTEQEALRSVLDRLVATFDPRAIYLFGSRAEGRARSDSDFDLLVVFDDGGPPIDDITVYSALVGLGIGCDVIACTQSELTAVLADAGNPWRTTWSRARKVHERAA
jgi:predicted nucleotidyltransferase